jgi:hypothetical protein
MRWAPLQTNPERFGIDAAEHDSSYDMVFSKRYRDETGFDLDDFCYLFERSYENAPALRRTYDRIQEGVAYWRKARAGSWLFSEEDESGLTIRDKRTEEEKVYRLDPDAAKVLKSCWGVTSVAKLEQTYPHIGDLVGVLRRLEGLGLVFLDESRVVSLVVDRNGESTFKVAFKGLAVALPEPVPYRDAPSGAMLGAQ